MPCQNITPVTVLPNFDGLPCQGTERFMSPICLVLQTGGWVRPDNGGAPLATPTHTIADPFPRYLFTRTAYVLCDTSLFQVTGPIALRVGRESRQQLWGQGSDGGRGWRTEWNTSMDSKCERSRETPGFLLCLRALAWMHKVILCVERALQSLLHTIKKMDFCQRAFFRFAKLCLPVRGHTLVALGVWWDWALELLSHLPGEKWLGGFYLHSFNTEAALGIYTRHGHKSPGRLSLLKSIKYKATSTSASWRLTHNNCLLKSTCKHTMEV